MLAYGSTYDGGLSNFYTNTAQDYSLLTGLLSGFIVSLLVSVVVSLCDRKSKTRVRINEQFQPDKQVKDPIMQKILGDFEIEWLKTMSIDNPLNPYRSIYKKELKAINAGRILTIHHMQAIFKNTRLVSFIGVIISFAVFLVVIPAIALGQEVLTEAQLGTWISVCQHWCLIATFFVVLVPPVQEGIQIWRQYQKNKALDIGSAENVKMHGLSD